MAGPMRITEEGDDQGTVTIVPSTASGATTWTRVYDLLDDLEELVDKGFGEHEVVLPVLRLRDHVETPRERQDRINAEAANQVRSMQSGRMLKAPCDARARKGTGEGICGGHVYMPGGCDNAGNHIE